MVQKFSCENTFLYDFNFEQLPGHINLLKLTINKRAKNWVFLFQKCGKFEIVSWDFFCYTQILTLLGVT